MTTFLCWGCNAHRSVIGKKQRTVRGLTGFVCAECSAEKAVTTKQTKRSKGPGCSVDLRYQVAPGERVWGCGFASLPPGKYVDEAKSLAAKAVA